MRTPKLINILPDGISHRLFLQYATGEVKVFDVSPYIRGEWYSQLADADYFNQVRIYKDSYNIQWPDGQDLAPHEMYEYSVAV
jgi:hypothetical protein